MPIKTVNNLLLCEHQSLNGQWQFRQVGEQRWMSATVPGCNFTDLFDNGAIDDPFFRCQEQNLQWIEQHDWEYKLVFDVKESLLKKETVTLIFDGLDTYCDVFLNGNLILTSNNMFVGQRVDCKSKLTEHNNELLVVFKSPIEQALPLCASNGFVYPAENDKTDKKLSVYTRKAPYHYGWDWGPKFVTSGIWRDVRLEATGHCRIEHADYELLSLDSEQASLVFNVELNQNCESQTIIVVRCDQAPELAVQGQVGIASNRLKLAVNIKNPQRWWPNGLGDAFLYQFSLELMVDKLLVDSTDIEIGLRTIEVVNQPDLQGESFYLKVNDHPVFMKGANYIPSDSFLNRVDENKYREVIESAVSANMNMLRVWGGGIYESDEFYRLADHNGILIWQDFMFACTLYPADEDFIKTVSQEAKYNIRRLKNHPCLALWCGNNEVEMGIADWQWQEKFDYSDELFERLKEDYRILFKHVLPELVAEYDPARFYLSSSPISFWENNADDNKGDNHFWGVWHGEQPFSEFRNRVPRFMSEYGFQSFPLFESVKRYSIPDDWHIDSEVMKLHQKHPRGNQLITQYMLEEYRQPKDFESFLYMSQIVQSQGMKIGFEAHRLAMPFCMGTLYWQFNDCWPVASWSSIDYYGNWKALHYQAKRSFEPIAVFIEENDEIVTVSVVSDLLTRQKVNLNLTLMSFDGETLWHDQQVTDVKSNACTEVYAISNSKLLGGKKENQVVFVAAIKQFDSDTPLSESLHYFCKTKDLHLASPNIQTRAIRQEGKLTVVLQSDTLVRQLCIDIDDRVDNFSDNFFDLLPGLIKTVSVTLGDGSNFDEQIVLKKLRLISIVDTYTN